MSNEQSFTEHLAELRSCIINILVAVTCGFVLCIYFSADLFDLLRAPILPFLPEGGLVFTAPQDKFVAHMKVSVLAGAIITAPVWLYQVWSFIAPALYKHEKKYAAAFIFFGTILFCTGVGFVYKIVFPLAFEYLLNFAGGTDKPMITISEYVSFFMLISIIFGLAFEMPLVVVLLGILGVVDAPMLREKRKIVIVAMAVLAALFTPPDAVSMVSLLCPLIVLYEISILIVATFTKRQSA